VLKVGVAGAGRTPLRVLEQGAPAALLVGRATDGMAARRLERQLGLLGARERVPVRTKLRLLYPPPEADRLLAALNEALATMAVRLPLGWPPDVQRLDPPQPLVNAAALGLDTLTGVAAAAAGRAACGVSVTCCSSWIAAGELWGRRASGAWPHNDLRGGSAGAGTFGPRQEDTRHETQTPGSDTLPILLSDTHRSDARRQARYRDRHTRAALSRASK
jgi:hypothetical protein